MIGQECIDELADLVGLKDHVSAITERAMRGEIAFEPALRERVALLKGLPVSVVDDVIVNRITLMAGARALIGTMRAHGAHTVLVSGGFSLFTREVAEMIGFDENHANTLLVENDMLTGYVEEPILGREAKLDTLLEVARYLQLPLADTMAVGDGANDLCDDRPCRTWRRLSRQARGRRGRACPYRSRRPHRAAVSAGLPAG